MIHHFRIYWHFRRLLRHNGLQVYFIKKIVNNTCNGDLRRSQRAKCWATLPIHKGQILKVSPEIMLELREREKQFKAVKKTTTDCQASTQFV